MLKKTSLFLICLFCAGLFSCAKAPAKVGEIIEPSDAEPAIIEPESVPAPVRNGGPLNGVVREFYPNGNIKEEAVYKNGVLNGYLKKYSESGTLLSKAEYQDGDLNGVYKEFYVTGKIKTEIEYVNNKKDGAQKEYDPEGTLLSEFNYTLGKLEGFSKTYYEDGALRSIISYSNNLKEGEMQIFSNNNAAKPIYIDVYKNNKRIKRKAYAADGKLLFVVDY